MLPGLFICAARRAHSGIPVFAAPRGNMIWIT